ncbi:MAG: hypothetical protein HY815_06040 [Candidatus Riflebacteria bacterium]|nr:hypothetical protein [Candidatus Riflebacteria bacterium]
MRFSVILFIASFTIAAASIMVALYYCTGFVGSWPGVGELTRWVESLRPKVLRSGTATSDSSGSGSAAHQIAVGRQIQRVVDEQVAQVRLLATVAYLTQAESVARARDKSVERSKLDWAVTPLSALVNNEPLCTEELPQGGWEDPADQQWGLSSSGFDYAAVTRVSDGVTASAGQMPADSIIETPSTTGVASDPLTTSGRLVLFNKYDHWCRVTFTAGDGRRYALKALYHPGDPTLVRTTGLDYFRAIVFSFALAAATLFLLTSLLSVPLAGIVRAAARMRERNLRLAKIPSSMVQEFTDLADCLAVVAQLVAPLASRVRSMGEFSLAVAETLRHTASHLGEHTRRQKAFGSSAEEVVTRLHRTLTDVVRFVGDLERECKASLGGARLLMERISGSAVRLQSLQTTQGNMIALSRRIYKITQISKGEVEDGTRATEKATDTLRGVQNSIEAVMERVDKISGIAEQTNLLALNAAIQAASGGEKGKSFALVAEEVRKLADLSADTTKEIVLQLQATLQQVTSGQGVLGEVDGIIHRIQEEVSEVDKVLGSTAGALDLLGKDLNLIGELSQKVSDVAPQLVRSGEVQVSHVTEVGSRLDHLGHPDQEFDSLLRSLVEYADKSGREAQDLERLARDLVDRADEVLGSIQTISFEEAS